MRGTVHQGLFTDSVMIMSTVVVLCLLCPITVLYLPSPAFMALVFLVNEDGPWRKGDGQWHPWERVMASGILGEGRRGQSCFSPMGWDSFGCPADGPAEDVAYRLKK